MNALRVEALKLVRSPVGVVATLAVIAGTLALLGGITAAVAGGSPEVAAKAGPAAVQDWAGLLAGAAQVTAVGGLIGFGAVLAWMFGREFTDGTITGLFALPVGRGRIALAKIVVHLVWVVCVGVVLAGGVLALGLLLGYGTPDAAARAGLGRQVALALLTGLIVTPVAWIATAAHSVFAGVGGTIALVILAQVGSLSGAGGWMPLAAPALWAMSGGAEVTTGQLLLVLAVPVVFAALVCASWSRLQLRR
ncbi:ABC transporter permease [Microbacterium sp. KUDC0406]|uniref:ABC transporter permease n=1 Tax=Microbacterium sp. KUDC0406 TaxID=2909588 RepID=UPI001F3FF425|nr:ABC transporter permease [Microbacterium sp. KUDC0406]UJP09152.1 ABC transporter permease [Microbacterium sp. KUDC0406]